MNSSTTPQINIRLATPSDRMELIRLAALDSAPAPLGKTLVALIDGELVAALAIDRGRVIADPFRETAEVGALLELRAAQLPRGSASRSALVSLLPSETNGRALAAAR